MFIYENTLAFINQV